MSDDVDQLVGRLRRRDRGGRSCRYCSAVFVPRRWKLDHEDRCSLKPVNRPHIWGTANAPGVDLAVEAPIGGNP
jgi:hypothetical protein